MKQKESMEEIEKLFELYYNDAYFYVYSLCKDAYLSEDIVMEAFYKAVSGKNKNFKNFKSWLLLVSRNIYYDYYRSKRSHQLKPIIIDDEQELFIDKMIKEERYKSLYRAISILSETEKECVSLYYFENLSIKDISIILNKTVDNVKVILMRARNNLRKIMEE